MNEGEVWWRKLACMGRGIWYAMAHVRSRGVVSKMCKWRERNGLPYVYMTCAWPLRTCTWRHEIVENGCIVDQEPYCCDIACRIVTTSTSMVVVGRVRLGTFCTSVCASSARCCFCLCLVL